MSSDSVRMLHRGVPQPLDSRRVAILLVIVMFLPIFNPVTAEESAGRDDFGVLEAMANALNEQRESGEDDIANNSAEAVLSALESRGCGTPRWSMRTLSDDINYNWLSQHT